MYPRLQRSPPSGSNWNTRSPPSRRSSMTRFNRMLRTRQRPLHGNPALCRTGTRHPAGDGHPRDHGHGRSVFLSHDDTGFAYSKASYMHSTRLRLHRRSPSHWPLRWMSGRCRSAQPRRLRRRTTIGLSTPSFQLQVMFRALSPSTHPPQPNPVVSHQTHSRTRRRRAHSRPRPPPRPSIVAISGPRRWIA